MPPFLILDRSAGEIATMAARNKCLARNNKSGIGEGAGPIRRESGGTPMNPFRGWRDEPVSRAGQFYEGRLWLSNLSTC